MDNCSHKDIKTNVIIGDEGDIEQTICAAEDCAFVLKEERIVKRADGTTLKRAQPVKPESQPDSFEFKGKDGKLALPEERLPSAQEMMALAIKTREETTGKRGRELAKTILEGCAKDVLAGEYTYCVVEGEVTGEIVTLAFRELKGQGYRVKKTPEPGVGTWINVKWPTKLRKKRKEPDPEIKIGTGTGSPQPQPTRKPRKMVPQADMETRRKQNAAAKHRKKTLGDRSKSPD